MPRTASRRLASIATCLFLIGSVALLLHWRTHLVASFPTEYVTVKDDRPEFTADALTPEECISAAILIKAHTWRSIRRVIRDDRFERFGPAYAFTGATSGTVYTLGDAGLDSF